ncbi:MAG: ABC transporter permease [Acidimicrobiales bacterium]
MAVRERDLATQIAGLDALEEAMGRPPSRTRRVWSAAWPKLAAIVIALAAWQAIYLSGWRPPYVLPSPATVFGELATLFREGTIWKPVAITMQRALLGYAIAVVVGTSLGLAVARVRPLRTAIGSLITGLQTFPSIVWFPVAILIWGLNEQAILFVVVLGAAPSIANGVLTGVDHVPPLLVRSGRSMGARGMALYRHVVLPASLPTFVAGLKQGWAFAWRSLMAGELLVIVASRPSIGQRLQLSREFQRAADLYAWMIVILIIGIVVDFLFGKVDHRIRRRRGLIDPAT